ncbi:MAG: hypothetical protein M5U34_25480 [Chloroflexi bacterium]|nr:hypothetical protein [Chloroflexota bacterium]
MDQAHFPQSQQALHDARRRLVFDELFLLQLGMMGFPAAVAGTIGGGVGGGNGRS